MSYAYHGAEKAPQPDLDEVRRRASRHRQRIAAFTAIGMLLAAGLGSASWTDAAAPRE
jgi:hypothetical protein